jgi:hypothetical protein
VTLTRHVTFSPVSGGTLSIVCSSSVNHRHCRAFRPCVGNRSRHAAHEFRRYVSAYEISNDVAGVRHP